MAKTFTYFAYGSNLLSQRIHINNPSAIRKGIGRLDDYRLDFISFAKCWNGAIATIVPAKGETVWGAIWEISLDDLPRLDKQEGVASGSYIPLEVDVLLPDGRSKKCRTYQQTATPKPLVSLKDLPMQRRPSGIYLQTIVLGAEESGLPDEYQRFLRTIPTNGFDGEENVRFKLSG